jgi:hypothetical protein
MVLTGTVHDGTDRCQQRVRCEIAEFDCGGSGGKEVQVDTGDVISGRRERLAVAKRVDLIVGDCLMLIGNTVRAGAVGAEEHVPTELAVGGVIVVVGEAGEAPEEAPTCVGVRRAVSEQE